MTPHPDFGDHPLIRLAPTPEMARDLCGLLAELSALDRLKAVSVLEESVDHPERSVLFYAYRQVRERPWLAEPIRDLFRHIALGLTEAAQVERLMEARIRAVAEAGRRAIRDLAAGGDPNLIRRLEDGVADMVIVLAALRNGLVAHVGGHAPQTVADYVRFSLPDGLRLSHAELCAMIDNPVRGRFGNPRSLMVSVDLFDPDAASHDRRLAQVLGEPTPGGEEDGEGEVITDLDARLDVLAATWTHDDPSWSKGIEQMSGQLFALDDATLVTLIGSDWSTAMLGMPLEAVKRVMGLLGKGARSRFLRDMERIVRGEGLDCSPADITMCRDHVLKAIALQELTDGGLARLAPIMRRSPGNLAFDSLADRRDDELNALWRAVEIPTMGKALLGAPLPVAVHLLSRLSVKARKIMVHDMEALSAKVSLAEIERAQDDVLDTAALLADEDDNGPGKEDLLASIRAILGPDQHPAPYPVKEVSDALRNDKQREQDLLAYWEELNRGG